MTRTGAQEQQRRPTPPCTSPAPTASTASRRALALVGAVGPVGYLVLVTVLSMLWDGYDPIRDTQSELGAVDAPHRLVMNLAGFMGLGVSLLASRPPTGSCCGRAGPRRWPPGYWRSRGWAW
jgi:hypothetical protein